VVCSSSNTRDDPASLGAHRLDSRTKVGRPSKIRTNADIRARFRLEFKTPPFERKDEIRAASVTRNYALVGTAFDYYLRFRIKRLNPQAVERTWIAEDAGYPSLDTLSEEERIIERTRGNFSDYLSGHNNDAELIVSCLELATIDQIFKAGVGEDTIGIVDQGDVTDMTALASLIDDKTFTTKESCFLNPTFGEASELALFDSQRPVRR